MGGKKRTGKEGKLVETASLSSIGPGGVVNPNYQENEKRNQRYFNLGLETKRRAISATESTGPH